MNHRYPWLQDGVKPAAFGNYTAICHSYLIENFLVGCKNQNVVKSVHLDVGFDPSDPVGETKSFDLQIYYPQMWEAYELARDFPDT
ncbi:MULTISPECIES: hypothetical protein [unclassified Bradyrhizobium]|uniref:hypothetical protein n=2 Tax=unclassified Bradyrhizobium TaxID=2631580 RepID=UPI0028EA2C5D|nr:MULTISPECIES: hypothetical protein [unclassified Bradyrhizobium]